MIEKQEDLQGGVKIEGSSSNDGIEGNCYEQNGKFGIGEMNGGEIKDGAKVAGVINDTASNKIEIYITNKVDSPQPLNSAKTDRSRECDETDNTSVTFSVLGSVEPINAKKLKSLLLQLQRLSGDATIYIDDIELGSIRLILSGSQASLERLEALFKSGELSEVLDIPVEDVRFIDPKISDNSEDTTTIERKRLAFTIAGNIDEADLAKLKAAVVETSNSNEQAKIDRKSRLIQELITGVGFRRYLSGADLSSTDLTGADLRDADLRGADLRRAKLIYAKLIYAKLSVAKLSDANLSNANLGGANLIYADLSGADLSGANLSGDDLSNANLSNANLSNANLSNANLSNANLSNANLSNANLSNANLSSADLRNANLSSANLSRANLSRANLNDANLSGANLSGAELSGAYLSGAYLSGAELINAELINAELINADLSAANLSRAVLSDAYLSRADLSRANLSGANLSDANLSGADLSRADLSRAYLIKADLSSANLLEAKVENAQFGYNLGISELTKQYLIQRGAIFEDSPGDRSSVLIPR